MIAKFKSLTIVLGCFATLNLTAATITVNSGSDPGGFNTGVTVATLGSTVTLRDAINAANNTGGSQTITFSPSLAGQTILLEYIGDSGNGFSVFGITGQIEIQNTTGSNVTIALDANSHYAARVFNVRTGGSLTLENVTVSYGLLTAFGGVNIASAGTFIAQGCAITGAFGGNAVSSGGGGLLVSAGTATLINCTITGNYCGSFGGGVVCASGASLNVFNCTITGNSGGGVKDLVSSGTAVVRNSILGDNSFTPAAGSSNNLSATLALPAALADNGGPTMTMAISAASPAVGGGAFDPQVPTDQRGKARPQFGTPDIGAYELTPFDTGQTVVNAGGAYWYLGPPAQTDLSIYRQVLGQTPAAVDGAASRIGQANDGTVLVENSGGGVYARIGSTNGLGYWQVLSSVTAGDGATWFISTEPGGTDFYIYRWAANGVPTYSAGWAVSLSVSSDGSILARTGTGSLFRRVGSNAGLGTVWEQLSVVNTPVVLDVPGPAASGVFIFNFNSQPAGIFTVYTSTNLAAPFTNWISLGAPIENPAGQYQFTNSTAPNDPLRFYRVTSP